MSFKVPTISAQDLDILFQEKIKRLIQIVPEDAWNHENWENLYFTGLRLLFNNPRDINNYLNILSFSYYHVKEVVNPVDFFAITALEVFIPKIYEGIRDNKDLFTDLMDQVYELDAEKIAEDKLRCEDIFARTTKISRETLIQFLMLLFPRLKLLYEPKIPFYHSEAIARKNKRICASDLFEVYFRLFIPSGDISEAEFNAILLLVSDEQGFALALLRLNQDERIGKFLNLLDNANPQKIPFKSIPHIIEALIDSGDLFPTSTVLRVHRILHQLFCRFEKSEKRAEIFGEAIQKSVNSLHSFIYELMRQSEADGKQDFTTEELDKLKKLAVDKIKEWAATGRLIEHPQLISILTAWSLWGSEIECKTYISKAIQEDKGLLYFLQTVLKEPIQEAITPYEKKPEWKNYKEVIEAFIPILSIQERAKNMFEDLEFEKLKEEEQVALMIFLDLAEVPTTKVIPRTV